MTTAIGPVIYSNLWVSLGAAALAYAAGADLVYITFLFCGTFCAYGLNMLSGIDQMRAGNSQSPRHQWWIRHEKPLKVICLLAGGAALICIAPLGIDTWVWLAVPAAITLIYVLPLFYWSGRWVKLRQVGLSKVFLIAAVWAALTTLIPLIRSGLSIQAALSPTLSRGLFILAITIPFDVRDIPNDMIQKVHTLPMILGVRNAICLALSILTASFALLILDSDAPFISMFAPAVIYGATAALISLTDQNRGELWYGLLLDGTMVGLAVALIC